MDGMGASVVLYQFFDLMVHREDVIPAPEPGSHGLATPRDPGSSPG